MKSFYKGLAVISCVLLSINIVAQSKLLHPHPKRAIAEITADDAIFNVGVSWNPMQQQSLVQIYDSIYNWHWDITMNNWAFSPYQKSINYIYDAQNNLTYYLVQELTGNAWVNSGQYIFTYDASNNQTVYLKQEWNGIAWENAYQQLNTYDINNNLKTQVIQNWNGSAWFNLNNNLFTYDTNNNRLTFLVQTWNGTSWVNYDLYTDAYNANNKIINETVQNWNAGAWENLYQYSYTYDAANNLLNQLNQVWQINLWINQQLYTYTYNAGTNALNRLKQNWTGTAWNNGYLNAYAYDFNNNRISDLLQIWNINTWKNYAYTTQTYDNNNLRLSIAQKAWNNTATQINQGDSAHFYYHTITSLNNINPTDETIKILPNPATTICTITLNNTSTLQHPSTLTLYDITGRALLQQKFTSSPYHLTTSSLKSGMYVVEIKDKERKVNGKLIIDN